MLLKLRGELLPDARQYGGVPRCSAENMLVDIWERILGALEGGESAVPLSYLVSTKRRHLTKWITPNASSNCAS